MIGSILAHTRRIPHAGRSYLGAIAVLAAFGAGAAQAEPSIEKSLKVAPGLYEMVLSRSTGLLYVASAGERGKNNAKVLALDPKTLETRSTIDVSSAPAFGLGLNDTTKTLYASNTRNGSVSAIDLQKGGIVATIKQGEKAHVREVVVDEANNLVYVTVLGSRPPRAGGEGGGRPRGEGAPANAGANAEPAAPAPEVLGSIWVIDGKTNSFVEEIKDVGKGVTGLALDAAGNRLFATALFSNEVVAIDLATRKVTARYPSGGEGTINVAFDPAAGKLFVANQVSGTVTVLDAKTGALVTSVATGEGTLSVAINPVNKLVYAGNRRAGTVSVIDPQSFAVVATLPTGTFPQTFAIDRETGVAYITNKAKTGGRDGPPVEDPNGDTVTLIRP